MNSKIDKLAILNQMEIVDFSVSGDELEYVLVDCNEENINTLVGIGIPKSKIQECIYDDTIDIAYLAFEYGGAKWFQWNLGGFLYDIPYTR